MIDLDAVWTEEDEFYVRLAIPLLFGMVNYTDWKMLTEGLGVFKYIFPDRRELLDALVAKVMMLNKTQLIRGVTLLKDIEAHYTEQQQIRIALLLEETNDSRIEKSPENYGIIDAQEFEYDYGN